MRFEKNIQDNLQVLKRQTLIMSLEYDQEMRNVAQKLVERGECKNISEALGFVFNCRPGCPNVGLRSCNLCCQKCDQEHILYDNQDLEKYTGMCPKGGQHSWI